jgi:UDP-N-acetylglucosamine 2-epimerase (non-hydrolysing)
MKVLVVAGARPNFMKIAPILAAMRATGGEDEAVLVHTGQHYDAVMSDAFFSDLCIPEPAYSLGVGSASHAVQTARVMEAFEPVLVRESPDWVVVVGDVNSTMACALVTAKLRAELGCRLAHVEAGLRSHDWRMPEEVNRVVTDRVADLLLTPSEDALPNLVAEGIPPDRIVFVGNVMIDTLFEALPAARARAVGSRFGLEAGNYAVATLHRPSNVDDPDTLRRVMDGLVAVARELPVVLPLHPRTAARVRDARLSVPNVIITEPLGYIDMVSLVSGARVVLTDSGGLQEETTALGIPCVTLREQTERPVTITEGTNRLCPWPLTAEGMVDAYRAALADGTAAKRRPAGWDGRAAERVVRALRDMGGGLVPRR